MRTMYKVEERVYTDCEGRYTDWRIVHDTTWVSTMEEAKAITTTIKKNSGWDTGDWRIVARTMNEATFTVTDKVVEQYDWWKEAGRYEDAERDVERYTKHIAEVEASKVRCKTEAGVAKKDKEIAMYREWLAKAEAVLAERKA